MKVLNVETRRELKKLTMRKLFIAYFNDNDNKGFSQNKLAKDLYFKMGLKNQCSARVMVTRVLKDLEENGYAYCQEKEYRNLLNTKVWYLTDKGLNYYIDNLIDL